METDIQTDLYVRPLVDTLSETLADIRRYQIALRFTTRKLEGTEDGALKEVYGISKDALDQSVAKYGDLTAEQPKEVTQ